MANITPEAQRELRSQITTQFGNLFEMLIDNGPAYKLLAQINTAFDVYAGNAQILTENKEIKGEFTTL